MSMRHEATIPRPARAPKEGSGAKANAAHPGWVKTDLGTDRAPLDVCEGAQTAVALALLPDDVPSGQFFHQGETLPW